MERATIYRAISAPTALVGGLCALAVSGYLLARGGYFGSAETGASLLTTHDFVPPWICALLVTGAANLWFLRRESSRGDRPFLSPGLRLALRSIIPSILVAAIVTLVIWRNPVALDGPTFLGLSWVGFYGLALLATMNFAPKSLTMLGAGFLLVALLWLVLLSSPALMEVEAVQRYLDPRVVMALTFGLFHLIYAACAWRPAREEQVDPLT